MFSATPDRRWIASYRRSPIQRDVGSKTLYGAEVVRDVFDKLTNLFERVRLQLILSGNKARRREIMKGIGEGSRPGELRDGMMPDKGPRGCFRSEFLHRSFTLSHSRSHNQPENCSCSRRDAEPAEKDAVFPGAEGKESQAGSGQT